MYISSGNREIRAGIEVFCSLGESILHFTCKEAGEVFYDNHFHSNSVKCMELKGQKSLNLFCHTRQVTNHLTAQISTN